MEQHHLLHTDGDGVLNVQRGKTYLIDLKTLRTTRSDYYTRRTIIKFLRKKAEDLLIDFFRQASSKGFTVCVLIHGFLSSHEYDWSKVANFVPEEYADVKLFIDWDTDTLRKTIKLFVYGGGGIITEGIENAYDINKLLQNVLVNYSGPNGETTISSKIIVLAHSMGSHVAEAFIMQHKKMDLKAVIFFNPHTDHELYYCEDKDLYMHKDRPGFVLSLNSVNDRVLASGSKTLQNAFRSVFGLLGVGIANDRFIQPLGVSWKHLNCERIDPKHRVVLLPMRWYRRFSWFDWLYFGTNHGTYNSPAAENITSEAIKLAMTEEQVDIQKIKNLRDGHSFEESGEALSFRRTEEFVLSRDEEGRFTPKNDRPDRVPAAKIFDHTNKKSHPDNGYAQYVLAALVAGVSILGACVNQGLLIWTLKYLQGSRE